MQTTGMSWQFSNFISIAYLPDARASRRAPGSRILSVGGRNRRLWRKTLSSPVAVRQRARRSGHKACRSDSLRPGGLLEAKRQGPDGLVVSVVLNGHQADDPRGAARASPNGAATHWPPDD